MIADQEIDADSYQSLRLQRRFQSANVYSLHHAAVSVYTGSDGAEIKAHLKSNNSRHRWTMLATPWPHHFHRAS